jgi:hypothetical protein
MLAGITNGAGQHGYKAVVPVDGPSAEDAFNELCAVAHRRGRAGKPHQRWDGHSE